jgi:hypothetical protein
VTSALRHGLPEFLLNSAAGNIFAKFVIERQDTDKMEAFPLAFPAERWTREYCYEASQFRALV